MLEYCSPVCMPAAAIYLGLLDRVVSKAVVVVALPLLSLRGASAAAKAPGAKAPTKPYI